MIKFQCDNCQKKLGVPDEYAGKKVRCPQCKKPALVPEPQMEVEPIEPAAPVEPAPSKDPFDIDPLAALADVAPPDAAAEPEPQLEPLAPRRTARGRGGARRSERAPREPRGPGRLDLNDRGPIPEMPPSDFVLLAIALVVGCVLPMVGGKAVVWLNFEMLGEDRVPTTAKLLLISPLIIGIAIFFVGSYLYGVARAVTTIVLGLLPVLILLADEEARQGMGQLLSSVFGSADGIVAILSLIGFVGLYIVGRAARLIPFAAAIPIIAGVGGGAYLISQLIPVDQRFGPDVMGLVKPFKMLDSAKGFWPTVGSLCMVVGMLASIAASVMAFLVVLRPADRLRFGVILFRLFIGSLAVSLLGAYMIAVHDASRFGGSDAFFGVTLAMIKFVAWIGGQLILIPTGIIELLLVYSDNTPREPKPANPPQPERQRPARGRPTRRRR